MYIKHGLIIYLDVMVIDIIIRWPFIVNELTNLIISCRYFVKGLLTIFCIKSQHGGFTNIKDNSTWVLFVYLS